MHSKEHVTLFKFLSGFSLSTKISEMFVSVSITDVRSLPLLQYFVQVLYSKKRHFKRVIYATMQLNSNIPHCIAEPGDKA